MNSLKMVEALIVIVFSIVLGIVFVGYAGIRSLEREEKCSKVNGIVVQSQQGWICIDSHIIKGYRNE